MWSVASPSLCRRSPPNPELSTMPQFQNIGTIDLRVDYLRPGRGKYFVAAGRVVRLGGRIAVAHMELVNDTVSSVGGVSLPATRDCPACCRRLLRRHSGSQAAACPFPLEVPRRSRLSLLRR